MSQPGDRSLRKLTVPMNYNSRQRVLCGPCDHEEPDRVPLFIGTSGATTVLGPGYEPLKGIWASPAGRSDGFPGPCNTPGWTKRSWSASAVTAAPLPPARPSRRCGGKSPPTA